MKPVVSNKIYIKKPDNCISSYYEEKLTYVKYGEYYQTYEYNEEKELLILPRGLLDTSLDSSKVTFETTKNTYNFKKPKIKLYDYQKEIVKVVIRYSQGILQAPCGSGKGVVALFLIYKFQQTTLVLVDELKIQKQWLSQIEKFFSKKMKVGLIGDGEFIIEPITIATVQTLRNLDDDKWKKINDYFGMVIVEESHIVPAQTIFRVINKTKAHYRFGITATPYRKDKLEFFMFDAIGPIIYKVDEKKLDRVPIVVKIVYTDVFFSIKFPPEKGWQWWSNYTLNKLTKNATRNSIIISQILTHRDGLHLVLSERVEHCKLLVEVLRESGVKADLLIGEVSSEKREKLRLDGKVEVIVGTKVADKALDIPRIKYVHLTLPTSNIPKLEQRIGRGARSYKGKDLCLVFDYIDRGIIDENKKVDYFTASLRNRVRFYKEKNYFFRI